MPENQNAKRETASGMERRQFPRHETDLTAFIEIILPEETFQPHQIEAQIQDISLRGMRLVAKGLTHTLFKRLIPKVRFARIKLNHESLAEEIKVTGKIVWYSYHSQTSVERQAHDCDMGICFTPEDTANLEHYETFVKGLMARD